MKALSLSAATKAKILAKYTLRLVLVCIIGLVPWRSVRAQRQDSGANEFPGDIANLKKDVNTLLTRQKLLIQQMDELKQLLQANAAARPALQLPTTLEVHGESFKGDVDARVALIEYSDFECPFCGGYERETAPQIFDGYIKTGKVKLFYRDLPLPMHPHAMQAARASHCAGDQGKFWEMHDSLFARQNALSDPALVDRAKTLGLDENKFSECLSSDKYKDGIQKSIAEAQKLGVQATPTFFIGTIDPSGDVVNTSKRIVGAKPYAEFQAALDELLVSKKPEAASAH